MKMMVFYLSVLLVFSCVNTNWDDTIIENTSGFDVTFEFNNTSQIILPAGDQTAFPTEAYQHLVSYSPDKRVYFTYKATNDGYTGWFHERESWTVKVINGLDQDVSLSADGWMDTIENIPTGDHSDNTDYQKKIFTAVPVFTVVSADGFPAVAVYNREADTEDFLVLIQRN